MLEYKIGVVGPSRIGKTTLMTCVLEAGESLFENSNFSIVACDDGTEAAITDNKDELSGAIISGMTTGFNASKLGGTVDFRKYNFILNNDGFDVLKLSFLDFPGGWLKTRTDAWKSECEPHIKDSRILMIPVDSAIIMEAYTDAYRACIPSLLQISSIENVVRAWAKEQRKVDDDCCIIIAPVKCETYLKSQAKKKELESGIREYYSKALSIAKKELGNKANSFNIYYCPIKTFGSVELKSFRWKKEDNTFSYAAEYKTVGLHPHRQQEYAGYILKIIVQTLCGIDQYNKNRNLQDRKQDEKDAYIRRNEFQNALERLVYDINSKEKIKNNLGFFESIYEWFTNEKQKEIDRLRNQANDVKTGSNQASWDYYQKSSQTKEAESEYYRVAEVFDYITNKKVDNCSLNMTEQI